MKTQTPQLLLQKTLLPLFLVSQLSSATSSLVNQQATIPSRQNELISSAPKPHSITRVHQIWTSTSSDRLDELSPDLIGKMKANVPFLEAYALRPRLVGASESAIQPLTTSRIGLLSQSSSQRANFHSPTSSSGFSELKLESASLSKTEHHHKRTTSIKKRSDELNNEVIIRGNGSGNYPTRRKTLIKKRKRALNGKSRLTTKTRRRSNYPSRYGSIYQDYPTKTNTDNGGPTEAQVKGDSPTTSERKEPFYANAVPGKERIDDVEEESEEEDVPLRVGDGDVEEDGDTEMVEPKTDGVDDDPEFPDYEGSSDGQGEEEVKRVNRGQPESSDEEDKEGGTSSGSSDTAGGGGLGATTGGSDSSTSTGSNGSEAVTPGVERADGDFLGEGEKEHNQTPKSLNEDYDYNHKNEGATNKPSSNNPDNDIDYRGNDEDAENGYSDDEEEIVSSKKGSGARKEANDEEEEDNGRKGRKPKHNHDEEEKDGHEHSIECLEDAVPGEPGVDYPILSKVNLTNFRCSDYKYPGYYADTEARCQVFHYCRPDGTQDSFLCPNGTIFSQKTSVCVWWNSFRCEDAPKYVGLNALLYKQHHTGHSQEASDDTHLIDGLIKAMKRPPNKDDKTKTGLYPIDDNDDYDDSARFDGKTSSRGRGSDKKSQADSSAFDELPVQRKSSVPDEADNELAPADAEDRRRRAAARLSSRPASNRGQWQASNNNNISAAPRRKRRASTRQAPPKLKSSSRKYMRPSRRVSYRIKNVSKPKRRS